MDDCIFNVCLVGAGVEREWKQTSQRLTAARVIVRLRERLKVPEVRMGIQVTLRQRR